MASQNNQVWTGLQSLPVYDLYAQMFLETKDPTTANYSTRPYKNFQVGSFWLNTTNQNLWYLANITTGTKIEGNWIQIGGSSGDVIGIHTPDGNTVTPALGVINFAESGTGLTITGTSGPNTVTFGINTSTVTQTLTGNTGGAVSPSAGNINVIGDNVGITITGNPGTHTLTASLVGSGVAAQSFVTGPGSSTTATGTVTPTSGGALNILGAHNINTGGAVANTVTVFGTNTITVGDLSTIAPGSASVTLTSGDLVLNGGTASAATNPKIVFGPNNNLISFIYNNVFMGESAGNTTLTSGTALFNVGIGAFACNSLTTGAQNTAINNAALKSVTTGNNNVGVGYVAAESVTTGNNNIGVGSSTLSTGISGVTTGSGNIAIGTTAGNAYTSSESYNILIGDSVVGTTGESNVLRVGTGTGTGTAQLNKAFIFGIAGITTVVNDAIPVLISSSTSQLGTVSSSLRYKENIQDLGSYSKDIYNLRPVIFNYKQHSTASTTVGLIAEEVVSVYPRMVVQDSQGCPETIKYQDLPILLLNEMQVLKKRIDELEKQIMCRGCTQ